MASAATQVHDFLVERRDLFAKVKVALLVNETPQRPTSWKFSTKQLSEARKDDVVLIFMNAHGSVYPSNRENSILSLMTKTQRTRRLASVERQETLSKHQVGEIAVRHRFVLLGSFLAGIRGPKGVPEADFLGQLLGRFRMSVAKTTSPLGMS